MDRDQVRKWKARYDAFNLWEEEQLRLQTHQDRFQSLVAIWSQAALLGHLGPKEIDLTVTEKWNALRTAYSGPRSD